MIKSHLAKLWGSRSEILDVAHELMATYDVGLEDVAIGFSRHAKESTLSWAVMIPAKGIVRTSPIRMLSVSENVTSDMDQDTLETLRDNFERALRAARRNRSNPGAVAPPPPSPYEAARPDDDDGLEALWPSYADLLGGFDQ